MKLLIYLFALLTAVIASPAKPEDRAPRVYQLVVHAPGCLVHGKSIQRMVQPSGVHTTFVLGYFPDQGSFVDTYNFTAPPSPVRAAPGHARNRLLKFYPNTGCDFYANLIGNGTHFMVYDTCDPPDSFLTTSTQKWEEWKLLRKRRITKVVFGTLDDMGGWHLCRIGSWWPEDHANLVWIKDPKRDNKPTGWDRCRAVDLLAVETNV
ncbi:hypothetical protein W97_08605 [Coniosporium apollinis CBS 100218]|uniref:Uncharacterized protein n=1 Tax=Coniosporium apollinis (strain CBS 100218) TaxID=1168221 RepID=R7Z577_CONA1|nr:uncharacterized protein W97_08605 [Coniosporium apollinis CBS 100218]EON69345.1 hypothetical protein W97_08605 [Coniosporium apollinis CBS 100218]